MTKAGLRPANVNSGSSDPSADLLQGDVKLISNLVYFNK